MGQPKALLTLPSGKTLLSHHVDCAKRLNLPILVGDNDKFAHALIRENDKNCDDCANNVAFIKDYIKDAGALSCLLGAMNHYAQLSKQVPDGYILAVSCDSLIDIDKLYVRFERAICSQTNQDVYYLFDTIADKDYPLLGAYRLSLMSELQAYLAQGERAVMKFLKDKRCQKILMPKAWVSCANFNTPQEFAQALQDFALIEQDNQK